MLSIGIKTQLIWLEDYMSLLTNPSITQDPTLYPGCCLPITTTKGPLHICSFTKKAYMLLPNIVFDICTFG